MSCCNGASLVQVSIGGVAVGSAGIAVRGDDVHMRRARQAAAAMCMVCEQRVVGTVKKLVCDDEWKVWKVRTGVVGCKRRMGDGVPVLFDACPMGVWVKGVWRRIWWRGAAWKGVPIDVRRWLWLRGVRPRGGEWSGCGCVAVWLMAWRRLQRRFPALLTRAKPLG